MSKTTEESSTPETADDVADDFGGDGELADIAALMGAHEADGDTESPAPDSEPENDEPGRGDDPSQETEDDDESAADDEPAEELETEDDESAAEDETDDEEAAEEPEQEPRGVQKRIGKLTARAKEAEEKLGTAAERIESLEAELAEAQAAEPSGVTSADPVANHPQVRQLTQAIDAQNYLQSKVQGMLDQMEAEVSDEGTLELADGRKLKFDRDRASKLLADSEREVRQLETEQVITRRETSQALRNEANQFTTQAHQAYPELKNKESEEAKAVKEVLKRYPMLKGVTSHVLDIGDLIAGRKLRLAEEKADGAKTRTKAKKPAVKVRAPGSKGAPRVERPNGTARSVKRLSRSNSGSAEDVAMALPEDI